MADEGRTSPPLRSARRGSTVWTGALPLAVLAAAAAWLVAGERAAPPLHAATSGRATTNDLDGDGLSDQLELRLGTAPDKVDTDGDGYSDSEELARKSSPLDALSVPGGAPSALGLAAYQYGGPLQLVSAIYAADGDFTTKSVAMGVRVGDVVRSLPLSYFTSSADITTVPGHDAGSAILLIDSPVNPLLVRRFGSLSFFSTLTVQGKIVDAGVVNTAWKDGVVLEYVVTPLKSMPLASRQSQPSQGQGRYEPIDPTSVPLDWTPNSICSQTMMVAVNVGPVIVQEVVAAECESGWDAYCDPACAATIGTTVETLDPGALIGG